MAHDDGMKGFESGQAGLLFWIWESGRPLQEGDTGVKRKQREGTRLAKIWLIKDKVRTQCKNNSLNDNGNNNSGIVAN